MRLEQSELRQEAARLQVSSRPTRKSGKPKVLMLTSGLGLGHVRAAQAIEAALRGLVHIKTIDFWSLMNAGVAGTVHATYLTLVQNHPDLHERLYHLDEHTWRHILESETGPPRAVLEVLQLISGLAAQEAEDAPRGGKYGSDWLLFSLLCAALPYDGDSLAGTGVRARLALLKWTWLRLIRRLEPMIRRFHPDAIVSTQMIPAAMASYLKQRGKLDAAMVGVVTDFGVHDFWKQAGIDRYCVAHDSILPSAQEELSRAVATGVPLMPGFAYPMSQAEARRQLQIPLDAPVILVLGGGLGLSVDAAASVLLREPGEYRVIAMPGKNAAARQSLVPLQGRYPQRLLVCEWTERMDVYLRAADIVVGKPGGITVAEALACGRPLLATRSLGGQEGFNVNFLERNHVGGLVGESELAARVAQLLRDRDALHTMQRRASLLGMRDGATRVAALVLELAEARSALAIGTV